MQYDWPRNFAPCPIRSNSNFSKILVGKFGKSGKASDFRLCFFFFFLKFGHRALPSREYPYTSAASRRSRARTKAYAKQAPRPAHTAYEPLVLPCFGFRSKLGREVGCVETAAHHSGKCACVKLRIFRSSLAVGETAAERGKVFPCCERERSFVYRRARAGGGRVQPLSPSPFNWALRSPVTAATASSVHGRRCSHSSSTFCCSITRQRGERRRGGGGRKRVSCHKEAHWWAGSQLLTQGPPRYTGCHNSSSISGSTHRVEGAEDAQHSSSNPAHQSREGATSRQTLAQRKSELASCGHGSLSLNCLFATQQAVFFVGALYSRQHTKHTHVIIPRKGGRKGVGCGSSLFRGPGGRRGSGGSTKEIDENRQQEQQEEQKRRPSTILGAC